MTLAEVEGDAVFVYATGEKYSRGETLLEMIEATYVAFRDRQASVNRNAVCTSKAYRTLPDLDLKFVTHYGSYVLHNVG